MSIANLAVENRDSNIRRQRKFEAFVQRVAV